MSRLFGLKQTVLMSFVLTAGLVMVLSSDRARASEPLSPTLLSAIMIIMGGDVDSDGDGVSDLDDAFPDDASESADSDGDGVGNNADAFPSDASETLDTDGDLVGNNADSDDDGDGIDDDYDPQPLVVTDLAPLLADFSEAFGGAVVGDDGSFSFPSGAESWAGFANENTAIYPFVF